MYVRDVAAGHKTRRYVGEHLDVKHRAQGLDATLITLAFA
jgi:hypothetical protein